MNRRARHLVEGVAALAQLAAIFAALATLPLGCIFALVYVVRLAWTLAGGS